MYENSWSIGIERNRGSHLANRAKNGSAVSSVAIQTSLPAGKARLIASS